MENWQSEYLQFTLFILLTVWLVQRGSPESKQLDMRAANPTATAGGTAPARIRPRWARVAGWRRTALRELAADPHGHDLAGLVGGAVPHRPRRARTTSFCGAPPEPALSWPEYVSSASFWERTLENWQSEFLAVGSMAIFAVYLRQRGSPESKPVGASHDATGVEG